MLSSYGECQNDERSVFIKLNSKLIQVRFFHFRIGYSAVPK